MKQMKHNSLFHVKEIFISFGGKKIHFLAFQSMEYKVEACISTNTHPVLHVSLPRGHVQAHVLALLHQ